MFYQICTTLFFVVLQVQLFEVKSSKESDVGPKDDDVPCLPDEPSAYLGPNMTEVISRTRDNKTLLEKRTMHINKEKASERICFDTRGNPEPCQYGPGAVTFNAKSPKGTMRTYLCDPVDENARCVKSFRFVRRKVPIIDLLWSWLPWNTPQTAKIMDFYTDAQKECKQMGLQLLSIENEYKWGDLVRTIQHSTEYESADYWTSALRNHKTGKFKWGNGCPIGFRRWASGQPNNHNGRHEDCVKIHADLYWHDYPCEGRSGDKPKGIICESVNCVRPDSIP